MYREVYREVYILLSYLRSFRSYLRSFILFFFRRKLLIKVTPSLFSPRNSVSTRPLSRSVRQHAAHTHRLTFISLCALACWLALERVTILRARMHTDRKSVW